jgi:hypothetical protein
MAGELGFDTGPYVNMAAFCDRAIQETDGVLSIIRVIDQINVQLTGPDAPQELPPGGTIGTTLVVMLKAGQARGTHSVQIVFEHPDTTRHEAPMLSVSFTGGDQSGTNLVLPLQIQLSSAG